MTENSGTLPGEAERAQVGSRARTQSEWSESWLPRLDRSGSFPQILDECCVLGLVRRGQCFDYDIGGRQGSQQLCAHDLAKPALQAIPLD
jgi:hypothetical protein